MHDEDMARLPLLARDGTIRAYALVDAADYDWLNGWTWRAFKPFSAGPYSGRYGPYAVRSVMIEGKKKLVFMHRVIMGLEPGHNPEVDHINRNALDNRRVNLRLVTHAQNHQNKASQRNKTSKYRGVYWNREHQRWEATGRLNGKNCHLGYFINESKAAAVSERWRAAHMPYAMAMVERGAID